MKYIEKPVKSDKAVIGNVKIPVFESLKEAVAALKEEVVLGLTNRQNASDIMNTYRAGKTASTSSVTQLNRLAKSNPALQKTIDDLVKKFSA